MVFDFILILVLIICLVTDIRYQKIYNKVIFPGLIAALLLHFIIYGFTGLKTSFIGFFIGFFILLIPYLLDGIGAGDVKLLALIGALKGSEFVLNTALYMSVIGGAMAVVMILFHKEPLKFLKELNLWFFSVFHNINFKPKSSSTAFSKKYPYGVAITSGALICLLFKGAWII